MAVCLTAEPVTIDIICGTQIHTKQLSGSVQIQFFDQCKIERDDFMIQTTRLVKSNVNTSFIPSFNLSELLQTTETTPTIRVTRFDHKANTNLDELDIAINSLQNNLNNPPANVHDLHHYCINYTTIVCIIIAISIYVYKKQHPVLPRLKTTRRTG